MFVLQTTTAVLIAFLALLAWTEVRIRLAKGKARRKDLVSPDSPGIAVSIDTKPPIKDLDASLLSDGDIDVDDQTDSDLAEYKELYHKLHNLEHFPEILPRCHEVLLNLLSSTVEDALAIPDSGILQIERFSRSALDCFLKAKDDDCTNRWEDYLVRRKAGGSREMFRDKSEAEWWLKQAAPVKYVDGAWLGHVNKLSTPFCVRNITKNAWQVMSEELGDGDLTKNHVHVYRQLMEDINAGLPAADSLDFIHPRHNLTEMRCWRAALAQLVISLLPHEFLPEVFGFNMAYESLPLHLLKTVKELRELRLNPYYFELHISIDNADSGHAAMALAAVADYIDLVQQSEGSDAAVTAWKRVQAGYILAEGLPTTPESPSVKQEPIKPSLKDENEAALLDIFAAKSFVAHKIHCNSRLKIGRRSLVEWLEPNAFKGPEWQKDFLSDLGNCRPWVVKGDSARSRLVKELSWEGKMFGSFTETEVEIVKTWIDSLGKTPPTAFPDTDAYFDFTKQSPRSLIAHVDVLEQYPVFTSMACVPNPLMLQVHDSVEPKPDRKCANIRNLLSLLFTSSTLLEALPNVPVRAADTFGSAIVRVLRAQTGFNAEGPGVAGMDEVHRTDKGESWGLVELSLEMCRHAGIEEPTNIKEAVLLGNTESRNICESMMHMSMRWLHFRDMLVGMSWAFMELHHQIAQSNDKNALLEFAYRTKLQGIADREKTGLEACRVEIDCDPQRVQEFSKGVAMARHAIGSCFTIG